MSGHYFTVITAAVNAWRYFDIIIIITTVTASKGNVSRAIYNFFCINLLMFEKKWSLK